MMFTVEMIRWAWMNLVGYYYFNLNHFKGLSSPITFTFEDDRTICRRWRTQFQSRRRGQRWKQVWGLQSWSWLVQWRPFRQSQPQKHTINDPRRCAQRWGDDDAANGMKLYRYLWLHNLTCRGQFWRDEVPGGHNLTSVTGGIEDRSVNFDLCFGWVKCWV